MHPLKKKDARIEFRIPSELKELVELTALRKGLSLSAYITSALVEDAQHATAEAERLCLSDRDREVFLAALESAPNEALTHSFAKYQEVGNSPAAPSQKTTRRRKVRSQ